MKIKDLEVSTLIVWFATLVGFYGWMFDSEIDILMAVLLMVIAVWCRRWN